MVKVKKIIAVFWVILTLLATCFIAAGCPAEEKKYVTIKVVCWNLENGFKRDIVEEWLFTPDISELKTVREYDGNQYRYDIHMYAIPDSSLVGDWYTPYFSGSGCFSQELIKLKEGGGIEQKKLSYVCDKGEYLFSAESGHCDYWNFRSVILRITVE